MTCMFVHNRVGRGIEHSGVRRGFANMAVEMFYVKYVEPGPLRERRLYCGLLRNRWK